MSRILVSVLEGPIQRGDWLLDRDGILTRGLWPWGSSFDLAGCMTGVEALAEPPTIPNWPPLKALDYFTGESQRRCRAMERIKKIAIPYRFTLRDSEPLVLSVSCQDAKEAFKIITARLEAIGGSHERFPGAFHPDPG